MKAPKEHKPQQSRIIQSYKGTRQRLSARHNLLIQRAFDLSCITEIDYIHEGKQQHSQGEGKNNPVDKQDVLKKIEQHPQTNWISRLNAAANGNAPGQCAEPHSLASALERVNPTDKITKVSQGPAIFIKEYYDYHHFKINDTEFYKLKRDYERRNISPRYFWERVDARKRMYARNAGKRTFAPYKKKGDTYLPCATCKQWVPKLSEIANKA